MLDGRTVLRTLAAVGLVCGSGLWLSARDTQTEAYQHTHSFKSSPKQCRVLACAQFRDEEHTVPFLVESILPHVDCFFALDHGSVDFTVPLIYQLFARAIGTGKLVVQHLPLDKEISEARQACFDFGRAHNTSYFMRLESDSVWFDDPAAAVVQRAREYAADGPVRCLGVYWFNAYQNFSWLIPALISSVALGDQRWLQGPKIGPSQYMCRLAGAVPKGSYPVHGRAVRSHTGGHLLRRRAQR
jgi:hypothetical protein